MKIKAIITGFLLMFSLAAISQDDGGCKDHALFSQMQGYVIAECSDNFEQSQVFKADGNEMTVRGKVTYLFYTPSKENRQLLSFPQILKYYENLVRNYKGEKIYTSTEHATLKLKSQKNKDIWLQINNWESVNGKGNYDLTIIETE